MASDYGKKVARAASTGGGVTTRGKRPWGWYFVLIAIFAIGIPLVLVSRSEQAEAAHPTVNDHWHSALGFEVCGKFIPSVLQDNMVVASQNPDGIPPAIHTHGDGIIHIEPLSLKQEADTYRQDLVNVTGKRATFGKFVELYNTAIPGLTVTSTSFKVPTENVEHKNGDKCDGKPAYVQVAVWKNNKQTKPEIVSDPTKIRLKDDQLITVALAPKGATIAKPPSAKELAGLKELKPGQHASATTSTTAPASPNTTATTKKK